MSYYVVTVTSMSAMLYYVVTVTSMSAMSFYIAKVAHTYHYIVDIA